MRTGTQLVVLAVVFAAEACGDGRQPLVVYTTHGREQSLLVESAFERAHPQIDVRWLDMGSQDVLDRVRSERANPQADVWYGGPSYILEAAARESLLAEFRPSWADHVPERSQDDDNMYFAVYETPAVLMFNTDVLTRDSIPADWDGILSEKWRGRVVIRDPMASGTMRSVFGMIMMRSLSETGGPEQGYEWLRRLDGQTREYVLNPTMLNQAIIRQDGVLTLWALPDVLIDRNLGDPLGYVLPASGTPVIQDAIALVRGARHPDAARLFIEWIGSVGGQLLAAREVYRLPTRQDIPADSLPDWVRRVREELVVEDMDWDALVEHGPDWMRYWDRNIRGTGSE